ncbi:terminase [Barnesiella propionica]|uniref:terminase n=1 Tax=Barnesiella propionica TaxID=2981781 RepID=UPI0011CCA1B4|nr:terminase [Barnesiella propionica]MCU6767839.1 terminase [Barnesiella propionica]
MRQEIMDILAENRRRNDRINAKFNPITGEGAILERIKIEISDFSIPVQYIPKEMMRVPLVSKLAKLGSIRIFIEKLGVEYSDEEKEKVAQQFVRVRCRYDFCFWAALFVFIKGKGEGGEDIRFRLISPQRKLILCFEKKRIANKPIRLILLKARQWGGSTATQIYMAWLQLIHKIGLNSLIVAQVSSTSTEIKDMFDRMINAYPTYMLHKLGDIYDDNEPKMIGVGQSGSIHRIPQRNCKIKIGSAESPNSFRGGDYNLVHCSEVGLWKATDGKSPEQIVRSACSGILYKPYTMIVYESTANGTGNFFQREYDAAKEGKSQFEALFVAWYEIDWNTVAVENIEEFATMLYDNKQNGNANSNREENGKYLWWLWEQGATLEAINWYILERRKYTDHGGMASECPSDDVEAFVHSGARVFDKYKVENLKSACREPRYIGDVCSEADNGEGALRNIRFEQDNQGLLWIWSLPEIDEEEDVTDRYLVVVDVGGRSYKADWSVICVFDRLYMAEGGKPMVVAQWYGHIDMDLLAWKAVQIAAFYDNALLVIESNTLETKDKERQVDGDQSVFILNQIKDIYPNLYARKQNEQEIVERVPKKYGFHTNMATKPMIISTLVKVVRENLYIERDKRCLDEYITYEKKKNGAFGAIVGKHDDLLMTRAIGLHICFFEMELPVFVKRAKKLNHGRKRKAISAATI